MPSMDESSDATSHIYQPLKDSATQIRLLRLYPAKDSESELCAHLSTRPLNGWCTRFEALSYTWGSKQSPEALRLDGKTLGIGLNLRDALRRLRWRYRHRTLWVDAICINQADDVEKTSQITIMGSIYAKAWRTVIWLGNDSPDRDGKVAMKFFSRAAKKLRWREKTLKLREVYAICQEAMAKLLPHCLLPAKSSFDNIHRMMQPKFWKSRHKLGEAEYMQLLHELGQENMEAAIVPFLRRPWFGRRWIIQEVTLARDAIMVCGEYVMNWEHFDRVISSDRNNTIWRTSSQPAYELADIRWRLKQDKRLRHFGTNGFDKPLEYTNLARDLTIQDCSGELLSSLQSLDGFQCHDGRDIIAALLGLWSPFSRRTIIDYSSSVEHNFTAFAKQMIDLGLFMYIIYAAIQRRRLSEHTISRLPCWIPDWRFPSLTGWLQPPSSWQPKFSISTSENGTECLYVDAVRLDVIVQVQPSREGYRLQNSSLLYTESGGFAMATNMDKSKIPESLDLRNGPEYSPTLHLVQPGDFIYAFAVDEPFLQGRRTRGPPYTEEYSIITHGLFVLRELGTSLMNHSSMFQIVSMVSQYRPRDARFARSAYQNSQFESIAIA